jgi:hypothetical protein
MKANMGTTDRLIRIVIAFIIGILYWQGLIEGVLAYVLLVLSVIFVLTSLINFCPLYTLFGMNTCKKK